jgi:hypothetical protein
MGVRAFAYDLVQAQLVTILTADGFSQDITTDNIEEYQAGNHRRSRSHYPLIEISYVGEDLQRADDQQDNVSMVFVIRLALRNDTHQNLLEFIDDAVQVLTTMEAMPSGYESLTDVEVHTARVTSVDVPTDTDENVDSVQECEVSLEIGVHYTFQRHGSEQ